MDEEIRPGCKSGGKGRAFFCRRRESKARWLDLAAIDGMSTRCCGQLACDARPPVLLVDPYFADANVRRVPICATGFHGTRGDGGRRRTVKLVWLPVPFALLSSLLGRSLLDVGFNGP